MDAFPQRWGAYVLIRPLGSGGMGSVFLALTGRAGNDKLCVVKRLNADTLSDGERLRRFRREADIARTLSHGAIAQTLAVDDHEGEPFIAQEFVAGRTLTQLGATALGMGERIPQTVAAYVAREVARALAYAHRLGIVHRDIAPDNVMVSFDGEVRLIDFGIARGGSGPGIDRPRHLRRPSELHRAGGPRGKHGRSPERHLFPRGPLVGAAGRKTPRFPRAAVQARTVLARTNAGHPRGARSGRAPRYLREPRRPLRLGRGLPARPCSALAAHVRRGDGARRFHRPLLRGGARASEARSGGRRGTSPPATGLRFSLHPRSATRGRRLRVAAAGGCSPTSSLGASGR